MIPTPDQRQLVVREFAAIDLEYLSKKKGKSVRTSPFCLSSKSSLERVSPVEHKVDPVATDTDSAVSGRCTGLLAQA